MEEDWGDIFRNLQMSAYQQPTSRRIQRFAAKQFFAEEKIDIGEDNEDYVENMLKEEEKIAIAGLTNRLPLRTASLPWLLEVRDIAIHHLVHVMNRKSKTPFHYFHYYYFHLFENMQLGGRSGVRKITVYAAMIYVDRFLSLVPKTGGPFGVKKVTVYTAVVYVDRFLSSMPIQNERFDVAKLLGVACLYLAVEQLEENEDQPDYESSTKCSGRIITKMRNCVVKQFRRIVTFVTPIQFIRYFLSRFCRDLSRTMYAKSITVELIMSILGEWTALGSEINSSGLFIIVCKMNDNIDDVPPLSDYPVGAYNINVNAIKRMEILVLVDFNWNMNCVTPFDFRIFFVSRFCRDVTRLDITRITTARIIMSALRVTCSSIELRSKIWKKQAFPQLCVGLLNNSKKLIRSCLWKVETEAE
uniref:D5-type cyclin n=1 Tax=Solanum tuberosum TaxID=4113 RepID=M1BXX0_SOLTU